MYCENCGAMNGESFAQNCQRMGFVETPESKKHADYVYQVAWSGHGWHCQTCAEWHLLTRAYDPDTGKVAAILVPNYEPWSEATLKVCNTLEFSLLKTLPNSVDLVIRLLRNISDKTGLSLPQVVTILEKEVHSNGQNH